MTSSNETGHHGGLGRVVTAPNLLSLSRLLLLPAVLLLLVRRQSAAALVAMVVCWVTDALDGYIARRTNQVSDLGRMLDHVVDKIWVASVLVALVALRDLPVLLVAAVIVRDLLILAGSAILMKTRGSLPSSDVVGKITGFAFALLIVFYTLNLPALMRYKSHADFTVGILIAVSFLNYLGAYLRKMTRFRLPGDPG
ncbi:CDP-alcohol phosphatidyltransferase family protein [candidate division WOR-3 bacterium]|nr:CDP-alcohol phosphatidyltransferase family protein [candidate division WOR-3 bacterium]